MRKEIPQDSSSTSSGPATERSDDRAPGDWRDSLETSKNQKKRDNNRDSDDLPEWPEELTETLEDTDVPAAVHIFSGLMFGASYESGIKIKDA